MLTLSYPVEFTILFSITAMNPRPFLGNLLFK